MQGVLTIKPAIFLSLQTIRGISFVLHRSIVALLTGLAFHRYYLCVSFFLSHCFLFLSLRLCHVKCGTCKMSHSTFHITQPFCPYSIISETTPAPTVCPPSLIANLSSFSSATGVISSTSIVTLSPGITISTPAGRLATPVTSVVLM